MYKIVNHFPDNIIFRERGPFISLYQPTHRFRPDNMQDTIRFKNLVNEIENSLKEKYSKDETEKILKPFRKLAEDKLFWNYTSDGLAILADSEECIVYKLNRTVKEFAVVADSFYIKPLIRNFQSANNYHILGLSRQNFILYEGNRYEIGKVEIDDTIPKTIEEVLGDQYTEPYLSTARYGGGEADGVTYHGQGSRKDEIMIDVQKYFRYVDKFIVENYSNPTKLPLLLVAIDENQGEFRNISRNEFLLSKGINLDYESVSEEELKEMAWSLIEPLYIERTKELVDKYNLQRSKFLGTDDLAEAARAAVEGRIETIMLEYEKVIPGRINKKTGELEKGHINNPELNDSLNDLGQIILNAKGEVVVLPKERMPSDTGIAAIYRY